MELGQRRGDGHEGDLGGEITEGLGFGGQEILFQLIFDKAELESHELTILRNFFKVWFSRNNQVWIKKVSSPSLLSAQKGWKRLGVKKFPIGKGFLF